METDSTIAADDSAERQQRLETVKAMTEYLGIYLPLAQQNLIPAEMVKQTLLFVLASFKYGRQLEDSIQQMPGTVEQLNKLQQSLTQCQQQLEQSQQQGQQLQGELQKVNQAEQQREDAVAQADIRYKDAQAQATMIKATTPEAMPPVEGVDPLEVERVQIEWFDAETRRMAVVNKSAEAVETPAEEAMQPQPVPDLIP